MSVAYEAAKTGPFRHSSAGQQHPGHRGIDHESRSRTRCATISRSGTARPTSCWRLPAMPSGTSSSNWHVSTAATGRGASRRATRSRIAGSASFRAILRADDQQQTIVGVCSGPPLESADRYAAHLLATILGDHTGSRLYWTLIDPGLADGAELSYQDYNQAGSFFTFLSCEPDQAAGQPRPDRRALQNGQSRRGDRGRAEPGQEQGARALGAAQRAADGPAVVAGVPLDVSPALYSRRRRARGLQPRHR